MNKEGISLRTSDQSVAVVGAYGHAGRFVVAELLRRGLVPILRGRDAGSLHALCATHPGLDIRPTSLGDPSSLDRALEGAAAMINCAGPFAATSDPVIDAALRARITYLDVTAESGDVDVCGDHVTDRTSASSPKPRLGSP